VVKSKAAAVPWVASHQSTVCCRWASCRQRAGIGLESETPVGCGRLCMQRQHCQHPALTWL
jgi:hypothetical protein